MNQAINDERVIKLGHDNPINHRLRKTESLHDDGEEFARKIVALVQVLFAYLFETSRCDRNDTAFFKLVITNSCIFVGRAHEGSTVFVFFWFFGPQVLSEMHRTRRRGSSIFGVLLGFVVGMLERVVESFLQIWTLCRVE